MTISSSLDLNAGKHLLVRWDKVTDILTLLEMVKRLKKTSRKSTFPVMD